MYSRSFRPSQKRTEGDVPVQYFGDSFSADAFNSSYSKENVRNTGKSELEFVEKNSEIENKENKQDEHKINAPAKTARSYDIEDLMLIGLLLLFSTDINNKEDFIVPIIIAAILLF